MTGQPTPVPPTNPPPQIASSNATAASFLNGRQQPAWMTGGPARPYARPPPPRALAPAPVTQTQAGPPPSSKAPPQRGAARDTRGQVTESDSDSCKACIPRLCLPLAAHPVPPHSQLPSAVRISPRRPSPPRRSQPRPPTQRWRASCPTPDAPRRTKGCSDPAAVSFDTPKVPRPQPRHRQANPHRPKTRPRPPTSISIHSSARSMPGFTRTRRTSMGFPTTWSGLGCTS